MLYWNKLCMEEGPQKVEHYLPISAAVYSHLCALVGFITPGSTIVRILSPGAGTFYSPASVIDILTRSHKHVTGERKEDKMPASQTLPTKESKQPPGWSWSHTITSTLFIMHKHTHMHAHGHLQIHVCAPDSMYLQQSQWVQREQKTGFVLLTLVPKLHCCWRGEEITYTPGTREGRCRCNGDKRD